MALRFLPCKHLPLPFHLGPSTRSNPSSLLSAPPPLPFSFTALRSPPLQAAASPDVTAVGAAAASPAPQDPIFLPHLEVEAAEEDVEERELGLVALEEGETAEEGGEELGDEGDPDPIRSFFESKLSPLDPENEGRTSLQKNRRTSWRLADDAYVGAEELGEIVLGPELEAQAPISASGDDSIVGEILRVARNVPENNTLGELLVSFAGKVGEGDCIELLGRMGDEGLMSECLYLFEWMSLQEPSLVTPRACSVLFQLLGSAGKGKNLMTLFENMPRAKRFRDVHVYNAAISGLAFCGR